MKKKKINKNYLIETIEVAENKAIKTVEISVEQDLSSLKNIALDDNHHKQLLSSHIAETLNTYYNLKNLYKASSEQFLFLKETTKNSLTPKDKIDFIATVLMSYIDWDVKDKEEVETKLDAIYQIQNLSDIVYETKLLELKAQGFKKVLQKKNANSKPLIDNNYTENEITPIFKVESIDMVYGLLKDHFAIDQQKELKSILISGGKVTTKLFFRGNANRLADAFKQLINTDFITGCSKKELENWIFNNFQYKGKNNNPTNYKLRYLQDIISTNKDNCKNPILEVKKQNNIYTITKA